VKILAIRGENLASLEGAFAVDFTCEPLDRAGLFAITGPTGAGKSTLLDALCLALFGTTPRVNAVQGRGHEVGRADDGQRISNRDPRWILRRGAGKGFAEVAFVGFDGKRYVARWTVRRARNRPDGKLQNPEHELFDDAGVAIGRGLKEVQAEIARRVGLDYEQFCRSVLLAQGEFAAFLRADEKKRAELLEAVTGTGIYRELSVQAHKRFAAAKQALADLQRDLQALPVLPDDARSALEAEVAQLEAAYADAKRAREVAAEAVRWFRELADKLAAEQVAAQALAQADTAWEAAAGLRAQLQAVDAVAELRPLVVAADEAVRRRDTAVRDRAAIEQEAAAAASALAESQALATAALEREKALAAEREALAPQIQAAMRLDGEAVAAERRRVELDADAARKAARLAEAQRRVREIESEAAALDTEIERLAQWRAERAGWEPVAAQWERWDSILQRAAALDGERRRAGVLLPQLQAARARAAVALQEVQRAGEAADALVAGAEGAVREAEAARPAETRAQLRAERELIEGEISLARELELLARDAARAEQARSGAASERAAAQQAVAQFEQERGDALASRERIEHDFAAAREALEDARRVLGLEAHRAELVPGHACPLCGSIEHPWAGGAPPAAEMVRKYQQRAEALQAELAACERRVAAAGAQLDASARRIERATVELAAQESALAALQATWVERRVAASALAFGVGAGAQVAVGQAAVALASGGVGLKVDAGAVPLANELPEVAAQGGPAVGAWLEVLAGRRDQLRLRDQAAEAAERRLHDARTALDAARKRQESARAGLRNAETALEREEAALREAELSHAALVREAQALRAELATAFAGIAGWEAQLDTDAVLLATTASETVTALRGNEATRLRAVQRREQLAALRAPAAAAVAEVEGEAADAQAALQAAVGELAALRQRRAELLGGASVAAVEEQQRRNAEAASAALEAARRREAEAAQRSSAAAGAVAEIARRLEAEEASVAERGAALAAAVEEYGIDLDEVRRRLATPAADVGRWRQEVERLQRGREQAGTVLADRRAQREQWEAGERPAVSREEADAGLAAAESAREQAERLFHAERNRLVQDDEARERSAAFLPRIQAAEKESLRWEKMHELIGSAAGDKFQLFAQSLTLDALLGNANAHLADLAPRYRLERAPGAHLELQVVDRDMADEVRSVNSLSGGETFLVSLALALGLSALSSRNTRVESLFIDEGFGTLDPQTLDTALATLDALQATGRKVGLISHVAGMAERVGVLVQVRPHGTGSSRVEVVVQ